VLGLAGAGVAVVGWFHPGSPHDDCLARIGGDEIALVAPGAGAEAADRFTLMHTLDRELHAIKDSRRAYARR
jgi:GGDEF domain-containing protein